MVALVQVDGCEELGRVWPWALYKLMNGAGEARVVSTIY